MLSFQDVSISRGGRLLFADASFTINPGEKVAVIGANGAGKSTLLRLLTGAEEIDSGHMRVDFGCLKFVSQRTEFAADETVRDTLISFLPDADRLQMAYKVDQVLQALSLVGDECTQTLSGGLQRRVVIEGAMMVEPDCLLLDEPTNHLDISTIQALEKKMSALKSTILVITHDRHFLQAIANCILSIDHEGITLWRGDYESYCQFILERDAAREKEFALFDKRLAQEEVWIRQGIKARRTRNEGRVRALKAMRQQANERIQTALKPNFSAQSASHSGKQIVIADSISVVRAGKKLVEDFSAIITSGEKIALIGPNGCGKTSLCRVLLGEDEPVSGRVKLGTHLKVAYFDQLQASLDETQTVKQLVAGGNDTVHINDSERHIVSYMSDFGLLSHQVNAKLSTLSGGQVNRVLLAKLLAEPVNFLVLDEPTNDLDLDSLVCLEDMLSQYNGTIFLISHDRSLLNHVATRTWHIGKGGRVTQVVGGYDEAESAIQLLESKECNSSSTKIKCASDNKKNANEQHQLRKEYNRLPGYIEKVTSDIAHLHDEMAEASFYEQSEAYQQKKQAQLQKLEDKEKRYYERWEELMEILDES